MKTKLMLAASGLTAALALGIAAQAAAPAGPSADPKTVQGGAYALDTSHAQVLFSVSHLGLSTWYGDFAGTKATAKLDPAKPGASSVEVTVPIDGLHTMNDTLNKELKSADWLDAGKFPTATFKSTTVAVTGPGRATITGNLTLHGVTKPIVLNARLLAHGGNPMNKKYTVGFEATGKFKRSDFGVKTYLPAIGDEVTLTISAPFEKVG